MRPFICTFTTHKRFRPSLQVQRKPNFFIIGAPKCATTSISVWLRSHPNIFLPTYKEPHYFNTDDRRGIARIDEYQALFTAAGPQHAAIGEASVWYLSSNTAVDNILEYQPDARFIVMVRNPLEMAPAVHAEMVITGHENVRDFAKAWLLQEERHHGRKLPNFGWAHRRLLYGEICSLGIQLKRLLDRVPAERVLVILFDDICADAREQYLRVLAFLGVDDDGRLIFPAYNEARVLLFPSFNRGIKLLGEVKYRLGIKAGLGILANIENFNQVEKKREPISPYLRHQLISYFEEDVKLLEHLLGRDFCHWFE